MDLKKRTYQTTSYESAFSMKRIHNGTISITWSKGGLKYYVVTWYERK